MNTIEIDLTMPGNPRYQPADLKPYFGYDNLYAPVADVELATMKTLAEIGVMPKEVGTLMDPWLEVKLRQIRTTEVDDVERRLTKHDVRAWIRIAKEIMPEPLRPWVHVPLTSYDVLDTGRSRMFVNAHTGAVRPLTNKVLRIFSELIKKYADLQQIGRTHGQHALPITVGFWLATVAHRVLDNLQDANDCANGLQGKISGAVGAHNAQVGLQIAARCGSVSFEERVLSKLNLRPAPVSTQILPPEPLAKYLFAILRLCASLGQFGRDSRHLMRTEIAEIGEPFEDGQVGSSTMAQKRNPINLENLEGTFLKVKSEFGKVLDTLISDHQRDLVGSSLARDFPVIVINLAAQLNTLLREKDGVPFLSRMTVNKVRCRANLETSLDFILAEPMYLALQMAGYNGDAHALISDKAVKRAQEKNIRLLWAVEELLREEGEESLEAWNAIPPEIKELLRSPSLYTGDAKELAFKVAHKIDQYLKEEGAPVLDTDQLVMKLNR